MNVLFHSRKKWGTVLDFKTNMGKIVFEHEPGTKNYAVFHCIEVNRSGHPAPNTNQFKLCAAGDPRTHKFKFTIALIYYDNQQNVGGENHPQNVYYYSNDKTHQLSWHFGEGINLGKDEEAPFDEEDDLDAA